MSNLHQLLAVKKDASQRGNEIAGETKKVLASSHLFSGSLKTYQPFEEEDDTQFADEQDQLAYTVGAKLDHFAKEFGRIMDIEYQIDRTNESAVADLVFGDTTIGNVPATFLLDLIGFLDRTRKVYASIPILDPKYQWEADATAGNGVFKTTEPEVTYRSKKVLRHKVLYEATPEHPAQVEKWPEDHQVGKYTKQMWSGALTAAQKSTILGRIDKMTVSAKKALSAANNAEHVKDKIADKVFSYLHLGISSEGVFNNDEL